MKRKRKIKNDLAMVASYMLEEMVYDTAQYDGGNLLQTCNVHYYYYTYLSLTRQ